jgi:hypothetical protein
MYNFTDLCNCRFPQLQINKKWENNTCKNGIILYPTAMYNAQSAKYNNEIMSTLQQLTS